MGLKKRKKTKNCGNILPFLDVHVNVRKNTLFSCLGICVCLRAPVLPTVHQPHSMTTLHPTAASSASANFLGCEKLRHTSSDTTVGRLCFCCNLHSLIRTLPI